VRIGILSPYSLTLPGGVQGQALGLARELRSMGHHARVLGPCDGAPPEPGVTPLGLSLPTAANGSMAPIAPDASAALRTLRALRDEAFDVLHLHEPLAPGPTLTALVTRPRPLVGTFHAAGGSLAYRWLRPATRWAAGHLDRRFAVSADACAMAREALGGDYRIVFNGVEVARYLAAAPWPKDGPTVLFVGRHEPRKGLAVLLEAFTGLGPDVRLWIGGDGPETAELQSRWAGDPRIEWLGRLGEEEKLSRLRAADVFCAPSLRGESFGIVLLEAMAAGTPLVASDLAGYSNVCRAGRDGVLVTPGDAPALAVALEKVLRNPDLQQQLTASGHDRAAEFSMRRLAEIYLEAYRELVG
jgi:phosphatidyl-myo-inositol alpha-mannosyltransferase